MREKDEWSKRPRIILTAMDIGQNIESKQRNPFDSIRAILTMMAVINQLSEKVGRLTHIVRANHYSQPLFDLLCDLGIYHISDEVGRRVNQSKKWNDKYSLYSCRYPVATLPDISSYVVSDFATILEDEYIRDAMKLPDPFVRRVTSIIRNFGRSKQKSLGTTVS